MAAAPAGAQSGNTRGLFVGLQYSGASVSVKEAAENLEFGSGFGLHAGLGISDNVSFLVNFDRNVLNRRRDNNDVTVTNYDALLRYHLFPAAGSPLRVFGTVGATGRAATGTTEFEGVAPTAGAGLHINVTPMIGLTGTALWTFGNMTSLQDLTGGGTTRETFRSTATRVQVGASLYLFR
ncbi:MAG: outer membrane beta-barrel protein [Gemmatimonadaceae bacterium]|nr:outer membrane beta-barrel protein [Gemmatimonadaceae bacterium]